MTLPEDTMLENRYRIDRLISHGGMGAIYRGFDTNLQMPVAIKENFFQTPQSIRQFEQEALILARLHHPGLPRVIHHFSFEGQQYLVMDYIDGEDLWEMVKHQGHPLEEARAIEYIIQVADAVSYLHSQNPPIIHRDIKPQNIKVTLDNRAVLVDFGIAKIAEADTKTRTGAQAVTPGFSPPEQYSGLGTAPVSDVYSLAATLYAVLTGKKPPDSITMMVKKTEFTPPKVINSALSDGVSQAVVDAMQPQMEDRPASVALWKKQLQKVQASLTPAADNGHDTTLVPGSAAQAEISDLDETITHWLIDSNGKGYPIGSAPIVIGRHSDAGIPLTVLSVSRHHAFVRVEAGRCFAMDNNSANGTFINEQPLSAGWHPLNDGDTLGVGSARFTVTTTRPEVVVPINPNASRPVIDDKISTSPAAAPVTPPMPAVDPDAGTMIDQSPPATGPISAAGPDAETFVGTAPSAPVPTSAGAYQKSGLPVVPIVIAVIILLAAVGGAAYFIMDSSSQTASASATAVAETTAQAAIAIQTQTAEAAQSEADADATAAAQETVAAAETETAIEQESEAQAVAEAGTQATAEARATQNAKAKAAESTATAENLAAAQTATAESAPTETPSPTSAPPTRTPTTAAATKAPTATATSGPPTATPKPVVSGPTVIPVETVDTLAEIGAVPVISVQINPKNPKEVYALAKGDVNAVLKSANGGDGPWGKLDIDASGLTNFLVDPTNPARLFAPAWNAVVRSDDGGNSWKAFGDGLSTANRVVNLVTVDEAAPNIVYGGIGSTFIVSTDGGTSWVSEGFGNGLGQGKITSIAVDPFNHDIVFVGGEFGSLYKSDDSGRTFQQLFFNTGRGAYSIAAHPAKDGEYLVGVNSFEAGIMKTTNAADFQSSSNGLIFGGADSAYSAIAYAPSNPNIVYVGSGFESNADSKGIFKSTDGGKSWSGAGNGLRINPETGYPHYVKSIAVHPTNPDIVFAGTGWGLYKSTDGGQNWSMQ